MKSPESDNWTPTRLQQALIDLVACKPAMSMAAAAREVGVKEQTARKWKTHPGFRAALDHACSEHDHGLRRELERQIEAAGQAALTVKLHNLKSGSPHVRHLESSWLLERILGRLPEKHNLSGAVGVDLGWAELVKALESGDAHGDHR